MFTCEECIVWGGVHGDVRRYMCERCVGDNIMCVWVLLQHNEVQLENPQIDQCIAVGATQVHSMQSCKSWLHFLGHICLPVLLLHPSTVSPADSGASNSDISWLQWRASNRITNRCAPFAIQLARSGVWMAVLNLSDKMPAEGESDDVEMESENGEEGVVSSKAKYRELKGRLKLLVYVSELCLGAIARWC